MLKKAFLVLFLFYTLSISTVHAGIIDPTPLLTNAPKSPPEKLLLQGKTEDFFCPLFKNFYNDPNEVAVQTILLEALGEGYEGMVAVGEVIRHRSKFFLKDFTAVCRMPKQFSCWNDEKKSREFLEKYRDYYFVALTAWRDSEKTTLTGGATDYHADSIRPYWADAYSVAAHIGRHIFYVRK